MVVTATLLDRSSPRSARILQMSSSSKTPHLVTGQQRVIVAIGAGNAHAVGIRVGREQQVGLDLLAQVDALLHGLRFGVGIRAGREVAVRVALLGNHGDVGHAHLVEDGSDRDRGRYR